MTTTAAEHWEDRYRNGRTWSGRVNASLEREVTGLTPGTALDLGCGEGGDALWLARQGWSVTAIDISPSALAIGASEQRPGDDVTWVVADLSRWAPTSTFDLVSACFLHSEVELPREEILRRAATAVAPHGHLLIVGHFGVPHWAEHSHDHEPPHLPSPDEVVASLGLADGEWAVVTSALVERPVTAPDGTSSMITDSVVRLRRAARPPQSSER
jgi:SAM-dependent methyltransferase